MHLLDAQAVLVAHSNVELATRLALLGRELGVLERACVVLNGQDQGERKVGKAFVLGQSMRVEGRSQQVCIVIFCLVCSGVAT